MGADQNTKVAVGEIWSTKGEPCLPGGGSLKKVKSPMHVVILLDDKDAYDRRYPNIRVAPISSEIHNASDYDLIIENTGSSLGQRIMIELWNSQPMLKMNLGQCLGRLSDKSIEQLGRLNRKFWMQKGNAEEAKTGESITAPDDPRMKFQEREIQMTSYLSEPVDYLIELWEQEAEESLFQSISNLIQQALVPKQLSEYALAAASGDIPVKIMEEPEKARTVHFRVIKSPTIGEDGKVAIILEAPSDEDFDGQMLCINLNGIELAAEAIEQGMAAIIYYVPEALLDRISPHIAEHQADFPINLPIDKFKITLEP